MVCFFPEEAASFNEGATSFRSESHNMETPM